MLEKIIDPNKVEAYFQPICALDNETMIYNKFEALLRYPDETCNEHYSFPGRLWNQCNSEELRELTYVMLDKVIYTLNKYPQIEQISLNISCNDIEDKQCSDRFLEKLKQSNVVDRIVLEFIEEHELDGGKCQDINKFMEDARELGCQFALDDFGKGYATFGPLIKFDFDYLKLDKVLVENFTSDPKKFYVLDMLINMCKRFNIKVVVEHIETKEMFDSMRFIGCDYGQGHYIELGEALPIKRYIHSH